MATNAFSGVGTTLSKLVGSTPTLIAEVKSISGPEITQEMIDATSLDSTGGYRDYVTSFKDGGTVSLSLNFTRAGYDAIKADLDAGTLSQYTITLPDSVNTQIIFDAYVQDLPVNITFDDVVQMDCTLKVSGGVTVQDQP